MIRTTAALWIGYTVIGSLLCGTGCAVKQYAVPDSFSPPQSIAVLPFSNLTNDLDGPAVVRSMVIEALIDKGYRVPSTNETDAILREMGISEGGQLGASTPAVLSKQLDVETLMYGELIEFGEVNIGFYREKRVEAACRLIDGISAAVLWRNDHKVAERSIALDPDEAKKNFARGMAEKVVKNTLNIYLKEEAQRCVSIIFRTLPPNN